MSLQFESVSYTYPGTQQGLHSVSFTVPAGELVALIGPSGSGKSTLLRLVSGLTTGHSGKIKLNGKNLQDTPVHKRDIGMVFQNYALFPHLNVAQNIGYGLRLRKAAASSIKHKTQTLLKTIGLEEYAEREINQLSGGQQQRVALARALAIDPQALLLDEPLAALDAGIRMQLRDQIRSIQKQFGTTTLLVTHDQEEALTMADRVAILKDGRLLQIAPPREIYARPNCTAVAAFVGLSTILQGQVVGQDAIDLGFTLLKASTEHRQRGSTVFAMIGPEHIIVDPPESHVNYMVGAVRGQRYLGSISRYDFFAPAADKPILGESTCPPTKAIAVAPEHIRLLDQ